MGIAKITSGTDRKKWDKIFNGLVTMLKTQQGQLETLTEERKIIEDRIKRQHQRWESDVLLYEDRISQLEMECKVQDMAAVMGAAKYDLLLGLKERETSLYKWKLEQTDDDLTGFRTMLDIVFKDRESNNSVETRSQKKGGRNKSSSSKNLEEEMQKLKVEYDKLASEKSSEVSALSAEKKFVWNQYSVLENNLNSKLKSKDTEIKDANEKIATLISSLEQLQASNREKDELIMRLTTQVSELEAQNTKSNNEILKLSKESRNSRSASETPVIKRCSARSRNSNLGGKQTGKNVSVTKESSVLQAKDLEKGGKNSKRKEDVTTNLETPRLFSSTFKVPKLKSPSPYSRHMR
ncbi:hypothetical protein ACFE04_015970 [Oxalis oulophora]